MELNVMKIIEVDFVVAYFILLMMFLLVLEFINVYED